MNLKLSGVPDIKVPPVGSLFQPVGIHHVPNIPHLIFEVIKYGIMMDGFNI